MQEHLIEVVDPTAEREVKVGTIAPRNTDKFLDYRGRSLRDRYRGIEILPTRKMTRTEADCLPELVEKCDLVINAFTD